MKTKKTKHPKTNINFEPMILKATKEARLNALLYIATKLNATVAPGEITISKETVANYSIPILCFRYQGKLWMQEFEKDIYGARGIILKSPYFDQ